MSAPTAYPRTTTRRAALAALGGGWAGVLVACDLAPSHKSRREPAIHQVLAPETEGKRRRIEAWNRRFGEQTGTLLSLVRPTDRYRADGNLATVRQLEDETASGAGAGLVWLRHEPVPDLGRLGALRPLGDLVRRDKYDLKAFMPCALQPGYGVHGELLSLPDEVDAGQLYFNRRHLLDAGIDFKRAGLDFERPGSHWDSLRRVALDLLFIRRDQVPWHPGTAPLDVWGWANGGAWLSEGGRRATFDRRENVEALAWLVSAAQEAGAARLLTADQLPSAAERGTDSDSIAGHPFLDGRLSLWFDSGRFMSTLAWVRPEFPIGYVETPRRRATTPLVTWAKSSGYALRAGSTDALWPVLHFLVGKDAAIVDAAAESAQAPLAAGSGKPRWFAPFTGQLPVDKFLAGRYRIESKIVDEGRDHALEQLRHARPREASIAAEHVWPLVREAQHAALRGTPPAEELGDAQRRAQAILDAGWRGTR
jgi:ABC-type glycerol-3-phosphate transport system substrate-binding protein